MSDQSFTIRIQDCGTAQDPARLRSMGCKVEKRNLREDGFNVKPEDSNVFFVTIPDSWTLTTITCDKCQVKDENNRKVLTYEQGNCILFD